MTTQPSDSSEPLDAASKLADALSEWFKERDRKGYMVRDEWESPVNKALYDFRIASEKAPAAPGQQTAEASPSQPEAQGTPRTDADEAQVRAWGLKGCVHVEFARQLETELAAEKEKKRPWSDAHTKSVIDGQVKEIDRLTSELAAERAARQAADKNAYECVTELGRFVCESGKERDAERAARQKSETERDEAVKRISELSTKVANTHRLYELTFDNQTRWMDRHSEAQKALNRAESERDALQAKLEAIESQEKEWECSALLYHSELRDLAEGKKVETQLGFHVEQRIKGLQAKLAEAEAERDRLHSLVNSPELIDFQKAVILEAAHQRERWGSDHDAGKTDADWFWLIGYVAGKALSKPEKRLHHIITTAAACANWHAQLLGKTDMRPGISAEKQAAIDAAMEAAQAVAQKP